MSFYSPYRWCVALNCKNSTLKTPEKLFINVPTDVSMRNVWLELAGRDPVKYSKKSHLYLCEDHFDMSTKIIKASAAEPDTFETSISQALVELETNSDLKAQLRELYITKAKEIELHNKKSIIIYVPMPKLKQFQKIQIRLVRELEKKFSGKHVVFIGDRKILPKPSHKTRVANKQKRPRSRTLTSVYDAILEDLVFPAEIVGKRIRVKLDGSQLIKVHLDKNQQTTIEHKVDTFQSVYKKLTGREVTFEFPEPYL